MSDASERNIIMGITNKNKELSVSEITCGGSFNVKLSLTAEPDILSNPTDIVLILDRSGSMAGSPIVHLKEGAKKFIDIIDESTDGTEDGQIGSGSRIGIVSFAENASIDTPLITSVADLDAAVDALTAGGSTNHGEAFEKAFSLFSQTSQNARVMVMFTDGVTTAGPDPSPIAAAARAAGVTIYLIGLNGSGGLDVSALEDWASKPASAFVAITPDDAELEKLFEDLAKNITKPGATGIEINDVVSPCFRITSISSPSKGTASLLSPTSVRWNIDELGTTKSEGATFEFTVEHTGSCTGLIEVNESISYSDNEQNAVTFPSPEINVNCGVVIVPEECPTAVDVNFGGCEDVLEFDSGEVLLESIGRILQLDVTLRNVCPRKRVALAVILTEVNDSGDEAERGFKTLVIPAHNGNSCRDVLVRCIKFVLPEELDLSGSTHRLCDERKFKAKFIANYIDNGFECCSIN